jgi:hypothetical protein
MNENWQLVGGKSNKALDIITTLKFSVTPTISKAEMVSFFQYIFFAFAPSLLG